jgi:hypothetical protein
MTAAFNQDGNARVEMRARPNGEAFTRICAARFDARRNLVRPVRWSSSAEYATTGNRQSVVKELALNL